MNKNELVAEIADAADLSKVQASSALDSLLDIIKSTLKKGDSVTISGFGSFKVSSRKARTGRNPSTGEPLQIPASKSPKFTPTKAFKEVFK